MMRLLLLYGVGVIIWLAVCGAIFQIANTRELENELFGHNGHRSWGTITDEFVESSFFLVGRDFGNRACFIICSYTTEEGETRQGVAEVGARFFNNSPIGSSVPIQYLDRGPTMIRVMIPEVSEYHDLFAFDMFAFGVLNLCLGAGLFSILIGRSAGSVANAGAKKIAMVTLLPSLFVILVLLALRQGW